MQSNDYEIKIVIATIYHFTRLLTAIIFETYKEYSLVGSVRFCQGRSLGLTHVLPDNYCFPKFLCRSCGMEGIGHFGKGFQGYKLLISGRK